MSIIKIPISIIIDYLNKNIDTSNLVVNQLMERQLNNSIYITFKSCKRQVPWDTDPSTKPYKWAS